MPAARLRHTKRGDSYDLPARRPLKIYAIDPSLGESPGNKITIDIPYEPLEPGPLGGVFRVVDIAPGVGKNGTYYAPVDLDHPDVLIRNGLDHSEADPRFHQQMVYAVAMRVLENFERGLGRTVRSYLASQKRGPLTILPHAFFDANAYFDHEKNHLAFGYFRSEAAVGSGLAPKQMVFTCLSHDIIAHELTHLVIHALRRRFMEPTNPDVLAFHEGYADIIALFQRFSYPEVVAAHMAAHRGDLHRGGFLDLARQFGHALNRNRALRSALDPEPDPTALQRAVEPHDRGAILLAALFDGFITVYERRIADLRRIATRGTGILPEGDIPPDLSQRFVQEASKTAQSILNMCVRAFDYLPPVDVTFGDFLRALVTADWDFVAIDRLRQLEAIIDGFRRRGIYPDNIVSLSVESLVWPDASANLPQMDKAVIEKTIQSIEFEADRSAMIIARREFLARQHREVEPKYELQLQSRDEILAFKDDKVIPSFRDNEKNISDEKRQVAYSLYKFAQKNAAQLGLVSDLPISVEGFHPTVRWGYSGRPNFQLVVQYIQRDPDVHEKWDLGGLRLRGGTTVIFNREGRAVRIIAKPVQITDAMREYSQVMGWASPVQRLEAQLGYQANLDLRDPVMVWSDAGYRATRMKMRAHMRALHARRGS